MDIRFSRVLAAAGLPVAAAALAPQSQAHHSFATEFDINKPVEVHGVVTKARFVNPHGWLYLDVRGADGTVTNWGFEFGSPSVLKAKGLSREDVLAGAVVDISGYRSKNRGPYGYAQTVGLSDGRKFEIGSAPDAPALRAKR